MMRGPRIWLALAAALAMASCAREPQTLYMIDPATGQPVAAQQPYQVPQYAQQTYQPPAPPQHTQAPVRSLYSSSPANAQLAYSQPTYQPVYQQPAPQPAPSGERGLFTSRQSPVYTMTQPSAPVQYATGGPYVPAPNTAYPPAAYPPPAPYPPR